MTVMTKDREKPNLTPQDDPWKITDEIRKMASETAKKMAERKSEFEKQEISCPKCGLPSKFVEYKGGYTRVRGLFRCENGHEFFVG